MCGRMERVFHFVNFLPKEPLARSTHFTRQAVIHGDQHVSKEDSPEDGSIYTEACLHGDNKLNRVFCGVKRKTPQEAFEAEIDSPVQTAFLRRPLHLSLYLRRISASRAKHGLFGCASVIQ